MCNLFWILTVTLHHQRTTKHYVFQITKLTDITKAGQEKLTCNKLYGLSFPDSTFAVRGSLTCHIAKPQGKAFLPRDSAGIVSGCFLENQVWVSYLQDNGLWWQQSAAGTTVLASDTLCVLETVTLCMLVALDFETNQLTASQFLASPPPGGMFVMFYCRCGRVPLVSLSRKPRDHNYSSIFVK